MSVTMRFWRLIFCVLMLAGVVSCREKTPERIPILDFFKTPEKSFFRISPDGQYISYLKSYKGKQNLFVQSLADGKGRMVTEFKDSPVTDYFWTFNNQIIYSIDMVASDSLKMFALDVNTFKTRALFSGYKVKFRLLSRSRIDHNILTVSLNKRDEGIFDVYHLNIRTGALELYITNPGDITDWITDVDGRILLARASDGVNTTILYRPNEQTPFKPVIVSNFRDAIRPIAFTGNGKNFYALSNLFQDKMALVKINAETGKQIEVVYKEDRADIMYVEYFKEKHRMDFAAWEESKPQKHFFNDTVKALYDKISVNFKGNETRIVDRDSAEKKFIVYTYSDRDPGSYYLYDNATAKLTRIGEMNSTIEPAQLSDMKPISYKASDGLVINGYLTLPQGSNGKNLPVVVMPHGGPWARSTWGYNSEVQFLANRGYAVLQMNFRGSAGYGKAFRNAGFKQVGGKIQQDITDGVNWLIEQKIADPKRIAIYGSGFGGFSALYGVSFHPDMYRCAIVQNGLINFFTFIKDAPPFFKPYLKMTYEMVGNPETDAEHLRAISPVFHADKIKVPLMILQGGKDIRSNITELNQFVLELRKKKVPVNYILKNDERSFFRNESNRILMYTEMEKFLEANLSGKN
ncbi:S9 family peptidase [Mucilaginibacter sp. UR6-1]|uniref:S9 family peptidase n=1 Tax=Mucilaginibacter sp. UR6-1 TaxID=1435643 RepID=UPI001E393B4B|nr:S9 family peptidase [Mucilaginibacter sp. UR6-1]MCC8410840.1 S9 family peptidase [Mucilaginibacter sp. UR6-1]